MAEIQSARPRLFIGSSHEGKDVALAIQSNLDGEIDVALWSQGLSRVSETTIEFLERISREYDFAALVVTPDDVVESRGERQLSPRDNIIFEAGLFFGKLGRQRTFLVCPKDGDQKFPSDLAGLTTVRYEARDRGLQIALGPASAQIRDVIRKFKEYRSAFASSLPRDLDGVRLAPRPRRRDSLGTAAAHGPRQELRIVNISVTGALLESPGEMPVGQVLDLDLRLDSGATVRVTAKVVRVQYPDWKRVGGVGVAFTHLDRDSQAELERFVAA